MRVAVADLADAVALVQTEIAAPLEGTCAPVPPSAVAVDVRGHSVSVQFSGNFMASMRAWVRVSLDTYRSLYRVGDRWKFHRMGEVRGSSNIWFETGDQLLEIIRAAAACLGEELQRGGHGAGP
jgi:hypothetical protein